MQHVTESDAPLAGSGKRKSQPRALRYIQTVGLPQKGGHTSGRKGGKESRVRKGRARSLEITPWRDRILGSGAKPSHLGALGSEQVRFVKRGGRADHPKGGRGDQRDNDATAD